jgi:hypothetical protein
MQPCKKESQTKEIFAVVGPNGKKAVDYNPYIRKLHELEYQLAREDYERRKQKRIEQVNQRSLITLEQLKKMAETDPCSKEIYLRIY